MLFKLNSIFHIFKKESGSYYDVGIVLGTKDSKVNNIMDFTLKHITAYLRKPTQRNNYNNVVRSLIDNCNKLCENAEKGMDEGVTEQITLPRRRLVFIL